jgi:hypothetical protein
MTSPLAAAYCDRHVTARRQASDGLIVHPQLAPVDGLPEVSGQLQLFATVQVLVWAVKRIVAATRLGGVHGYVRAALQNVRVVTVIGCHRYANACARRDGDLLQLEGLL